MEYSQCVRGETEGRLKEFYANVAKHVSKDKVAGGYVSGGTAATGGLSAINEYADSVYSSAKEGLIRKIAKDMNEILGIKGNKRFNVDGDISEIAAQMNEILPNPRKRRGVRSNKDGETKYTAIHKDLCKALAESINKNYGSGIIDLEQSDNALCNSVSEVIHSLISGMHSEFSTIAADVSQVIRNLTVMMEFLKRSHEKLKTVVLASNDPSIVSQSEVIDKFYEKLVKETNRQLAVLNNLMGGVVSPVGNDFLQILRETEDFKGFVEDIKGTLGSEEFGNKLGYLLAGVNNVAQTAKMVDKALKEIGMNVKQYKQTSGIENLRDEIYNLLSKADKMTADELIKFMKAADVLYRNDMQHPQIVEYLEKHNVSGGGPSGGCENCGVSGGCGCQSVFGGRTGGADLDFKDMFERKESLTTNKFAQQDKVRKMIFTDFEKQLLTMYQRIVGIVQQIGPKIGTEIAVSDDLMKFVRAFNQIEGANRTSIASALSGYNKSGVAKEMRNSFLSSLEVTDITLDSLVSKNSLFRDLRQEINLLIKLVDQFSTKFLDAVTMMPSFSTVSKTLGGEIGGEIGGVIVSTDPPIGAVERYASFSRAQFQLYYFSRIASIKRSMARAATEKKSVSEDYIRIVGQSTARLINEQATDFKKQIDSLSYWDKPYSSWADEKEFNEKLPTGTSGRALYFYVNTLSGFEPVKSANIPNYFRGNIEGDGMFGPGYVHGAPDFDKATTIPWNTFALGAPVLDEFQTVWNFEEATAPPNPAIRAVRAPAATSHTPPLAWLDNARNGGAAVLTSHLAELLGIKEITELTQDKRGGAAIAGVLPKAFDRTFPDSVLGKRIKAATKLVENIKLLETKAFDAKKSLIEVAENIDLYLSSFTDSMLAKPESLLSLAKIMQRVAMVRKMYTEVSGDNLAKVFEMFPVNILNGAETGSTANVADPNYYKSGVVRKSGQSLSSVEVPGNAPEYKAGENYYEYIKNVSDSNSCLGNHRLAFDLSDITGTNLENLLKNIEKAVLGVRTLENILLAFVQIGNEQTNQTFLTHGKVLKSLFNYVTISAITRHYAGQAVANTPFDFSAGANFNTVADSVFTAPNTVTEKVASFDLYGPLKLALTVAMNQISAYSGNTTFKDDFKTTDQLMEMIMKAICAKVLTVLGLYQIYNKPTENYLSFSAIRSIIGGGSVERPKIIPEAVDLYVRLPLLAEWFRQMLIGPSTSTNRNFITSDNYMLAMVPDVTNLWGEFLKTIFIKSENVEEGNYSDDDTATLITEINKIYVSYKSKNENDTVLSACEGLVSEINTRYSIIKKTDVDNYWKRLKGDRFKDEIYQKTDDDFVDYDPLDSNNGVKIRPAPSDRYMDINLIAAVKEGNWSSETFDVIKSLHAKMFKSFNDDYKESIETLGNAEQFINEGKFSILKYSFDGIIRQYKDELKVSSSEEEKYKIACKAIQDVGKMSDVNPDKIVMLHEFVIAPLTSLMSTYNMVKNVIESLIWMSKPCLNKVLEYLNGIRTIPFSTIGVAAPVGLGVNDTKLEETGGADRVNQNIYDKVLEMALEYYNPVAAPFLKELFVKFGEFGEHGYNPTATVVFNQNAASGVETTKAEFSRLLSTKRLFKTHMQIFANLKCALGDKFTINFTNKSYPVVSLNGLVSHCETVLNNAKKMLVYLRPSLPLHVIKKYEDPSNVGSVYWLEENMFSELFYNEKNETEFEKIASPTIPVNTGHIQAYFSAENYKINATIPLLNSILKESFGLVVTRSANNAINGKSLCEKGMLELCTWGSSGNQTRLEVNNDSKRHFPFNVVDLIDDIDPAIGKIRKLLLDKKLQTTIVELTKKLESIEGIGVNISARDKIYRLLRPLVSSGPGNVRKGIPARPNTSINKAKNLDDGMDYDVLTDVSYWLDYIVIPRFMTSAANNDKIGSPAFGLPIAPFAWDGAVAAATNAGAGYLGVPMAAGGADENDPSFANSATWAAYKDALEDHLEKALSGRRTVTLDTLAGGTAAVTFASSNVFPVQPSGIGAPALTVAAKLDTWLNGQIETLNETFEPYFTAFEYINDPDVNAMLDELGVPVSGAAGAAAAGIDIRAYIDQIKTALSQVRFMLGYRHLAEVTSYGNAAGATSLGIDDAGGGDLLYVSDTNFTNALNTTVTNVLNKLYNNTNNSTVQDPNLSTIIAINYAEHATNPGQLTSLNINNNLRSASNAWITAAVITPLISLSEYIRKRPNSEGTLYEFISSFALKLHGVSAANPSHNQSIVFATTIYGFNIFNGNLHGDWVSEITNAPETPSAAIPALIYIGNIIVGNATVATAMNNIIAQTLINANNPYNNGHGLFQINARVRRIFPRGVDVAGVVLDNTNNPLAVLPNSATAGGAAAAANAANVVRGVGDIGAQINTDIANAYVAGAAGGDLVVAMLNNYIAHPLTVLGTRTWSNLINDIDDPAKLGAINALGDSAAAADPLFSLNLIALLVAAAEQGLVTALSGIGYAGAPVNTAASLAVLNALGLYNALPGINGYVDGSVAISTYCRPRSLAAYVPYPSSYGLAAKIADRMDIHGGGVDAGTIDNVLYRGAVRAGAIAGAGAGILPAVIAAVVAGINNLDLAARTVSNTELKISAARCSGGRFSLTGYNTLFSVENINLTSLNTQGNTVDVNYAAFITNNIRTIINRLVSPQRSQIGADFDITPADQKTAEAWLRKLVLKYAGSKETNFWRTEMNKVLSDFYGYDFNNNQNLRPNTAGLNAAFIVNRINLYDQWSDKGIMSTNKDGRELSVFNSRGLLVQFNQLLAAYIGTFIEPGNKKFYAPLVEGITSGKLSDAISSGNALADINITDANALGIAPEGTILCASIARAIRVLLYKKQENSKESMHACNSLLEVAGFMRESMKANLPHFAKMFNQLADVASTYKKIILDNHTKLKMERTATSVGVNPGNPFGLIPYVDQVADSERMFSRSQVSYVDPNKALNESDCNRYYRVLLDNIELACMSITRCISNVYKELNDVPLFGETYSGSLLDLKQKSGKYPLALPSIIQTFLHHDCYDNGVGLPAAQHGSDGFKLLFMTRRVLTETNNSKVSGGGLSSLLDYMPGFIETINSYNSIAAEPSKIPKPLIDSSIKNNIDLVNLLIDLKVRGSWITDYNSCGSNLFRREIYGSATRLDVDKAGAFNALNSVQQNNLRNTAEFKEYARLLGLSPTDKNQSIYILKAPNKKVMMNIEGAKLEVTRSGLYLKKFDNLDADSVRMYNIVGAWPAIPGAGGAVAIGVRPVPAGNEVSYVPAYSDTLRHPTSLGTYPFMSARNLSELITLVESTDIQYNKRHLLELFTNMSTEYNSRNKSRFYNILDLNISPINVHALQSKVPLINLLNYSFTFDKFVVEKLGISGLASDSEIFPENAPIDNVKSAFARMLIHPYKHVTPDQFNTWHSRVAVGATGSDIPMDRPRYFSDQIYNKVCLQSLNPSDFTSPGGPGYVMENLRSTSVNNADLIATASLLVVTAELLNNLNVGDVAASINRYNSQHKSMINSALASVIQNMGAGVGVVANSILALQHGTAAAAGANLTVAWVNTWLTNTTAHIDTQKTAVDTAIDVAVISAETKSIRKRFNSLICNAVTKAARAIADYAKTQIAPNPGAGNYASADDRIRYTCANNGRPAHQDEIFDAAVWNRTATIYIAEELLGFTNNGNTALQQRVDALYYINDNEEVKRVDLKNNGSLIVNGQGKLRYDTRLVRNLSWFSHLHRFLLWSIKDSLVRSSQPVVSDQGVIDPTLIDFRGYQSQKRSEYHL
jgi:hypothetical protein